MIVGFRDKILTCESVKLNRVKQTKQVQQLKNRLSDYLLKWKIKPFLSFKRLE
jgi:hypothetical protein